MISEINTFMAKQNDADQSHFFFINCYLTKIQNPESIFYPSCMGEKCSKKVVDMGNGQWRCEACNKNFAGFKPTYMIKARVADFSDSLYVSFMRE